jgi:hypothetical protein
VRLDLQHEGPKVTGILRWVTGGPVRPSRAVGLAAPASANPSSLMVAGAGFEPATFGLRVVSRLCR